MRSYYFWKRLDVVDDWFFYGYRMLCGWSCIVLVVGVWVWIGLLGDFGGVWYGYYNDWIVGEIVV